MHQCPISALALCCTLSIVVFGSAPGVANQAKKGEAPQTEAKSPPRSVSANEFSDSPEGAFKSLFLAMILQDEKALRRASLPLPAGDLKILLGSPSPPERIAEFKDQFLPTIKFRRLKVGEQVKLPGGQIFEVKPTEVTADRAVIIMEGDSIPFRCHRIDGHWKVDAGPLIAARKAAAVVRKRNASKKKK